MLGSQVTNSYRLTELLEFVYEDDSVLAVTKPAGVACQSSFPSRSINTAKKNDSINDILPSLAERFKCKKLVLTYPLHRDYSGVVLLSKSQQTHEYLANQYHQHCLAQRLPWQTYSVLVLGETKEQKEPEIVHVSRSSSSTNITISVCKPAASGKPSGDRQAMKHNLIRPQIIYESLAYNKELDVSYLRLKTASAKWDALQAFLLMKKCPVIGDDKYGSLCTTLMGRKILKPHTSYDGTVTQKLPDEVYKVLLKNEEKIPVMIDRSEITLMMRKKQLVIASPLSSTFKAAAKALHLLPK